jgi:hypothetical protein
MKLVGLVKVTQPFTAKVVLVVIVVVLIFPSIAMALLWTAEKRLGLILLSLSLFGSLVFGVYHHFLAVGPDHVHCQPSKCMGDYVCPDRISVAHHRSDWELRSAFNSCGFCQIVRARPLSPIPLRIETCDDRIESSSNLYNDRP